MYKHHDWVMCVVSDPSRMPALGISHGHIPNLRLTGSRNWNYVPKPRITPAQNLELLGHSYMSIRIESCSIRITKIHLNIHKYIHR